MLAAERVTSNCGSACLFSLIKLVEQFQGMLRITAPRAFFKLYPRIEVGMRHGRQFINQFLTLIELEIESALRRSCLSSGNRKVNVDTGTSPEIVPA